MTGKFDSVNVLELKFEVEEVLSGSYSGNIIHVIGFAHSGGFSQYLTEMAIYLALIKRNDVYFLSGIGVLRDVDNEEWI